MLYSSTGEVVVASVESTDANTYRPFKTLDSTVMASIAERLDSYDDVAEEGEAYCFYARTLSVHSFPPLSPDRSRGVPD